MQLKETQSKLYKIITAPVGVHKILSARQQKNLPLVSDTRLSAAERLDIYANMYFFRIRDSLIEDFPAVHKILGDARFHNLVTDYLIKFPPTHFSLRNAGKNLPRFLKTHRESKKHKFLPSLALFEWHMIEIFDAADSQNISKEALAEVKPEAWANLKLEFIPALKLMSFDYPISEMFVALRTKKKIVVKKSKNSVLIWRQDFKVYHRNLDLFEQKLMTAMLTGKTFAKACAVVAGKNGGEKAMQRIGACLLRWFDEKLISRLHT